MILGGVMFTYGLIEIVQVVSQLNMNETELMDNLHHVTEWAKYYEFPDDLVQDIKSYFHYRHNHVADSRTLLRSWCCTLHVMLVHCRSTVRLRKRGGQESQR